MAVVTPRILGVGDIVKEHERRLQKYKDRDAFYDKLLDYYFGRNGQAQGGLPILPANSQGRPLLRPVGETIMVDRMYSTRRLTPIVDDYASLIGRIPNVRSEPPDGSEQAQRKAELLTKYLYSTYELSRLKYQQAQAGFWLSCLGDAVYVIEPHPRSLRVAWNIVCPRSVYPAFLAGPERFRLHDVLIAEQWQPEEIEHSLGVKPDGDRDEDCTVLTYISANQRTVVVGTRYPVQAAHAEWNLDMCPAVWAFNKLTGHMGMADIAASLQQQDFLDFALNVWADGIVYMTYPMIGVKDPLNIGADQIQIGPGAPPVTLQGDGDIIVRQTQGTPQALLQIIQQTINDMNAATGTSAVRQEGQMEGSIITGRAVHAVQGPQSTRVELKQEMMAEVFREANMITLHMQEKAPYLREFKGPIFGRMRGQSFQEMFDASRDIDGWYRTSVSWEALVGMNLQQKVAVAYEGMVAKLWDDLTAREMAGIEDPIGMRTRIETQLREEAKLQSELQGVMGGAAAGQQGGGQPPQGAQAMRPPTLIKAPQGFAANAMAQGSALGPVPGGQPFGATLEAVQRAVRNLADQLRGTVWAIGDLAKRGSAIAPQLAISDPRDYTKVLAAVRQLAAAVKVRQMAESKLPPEAVRLV